ncbi:NAD-dependent epimerase/dehydratase family protein [Streptomyces triticagri]|uniref:NAD-dependent epimerase/dehydratase family protein n=1 Tax=Streptomyces triticagri TaxID=2293568 RepID=A0A372MB60_9ACTN|nr:NAD-dependent epimerase/dehydratase family protein [Streptomyces triticagri]RFU88129.1 NAD-dependent epimerase/dehydratase family protein [Streptomyces triticagri]
MPTTSNDLHVVLGAGPAGTTVATELARRGHAVRLVDRTAEGPAPAGVLRARGDVGTLEGARAAIAGAAVVYHCVNVAYHRQIDLLPGIQDAVLGAVRAEGARLVVLDTLYPYGETGGAVMSEDTPWRATSAKGRMRAALDEKYLAAHRAGHTRVVLGRSADFVGPGVLNSTLGGGVFPGALAGTEVYGLGDIDLPHSYTDIRAVAEGLATLGEHPEGDGRVWHLPTAPARSTREVFHLIEERVGRTLDVVVKPDPVPFGPFDEVFVSSYAELWYQHTEPQIMDSTAIRNAFGLDPFDIGDTLDATLDWYRAFLATARG